MKLNETEVNNYLRPFLGQYEDSFQQAWVDILECNPQTLEEVTPIMRSVRNKAIKQYLNNKYREESLYKSIQFGIWGIGNKVFSLFLPSLTSSKSFSKTPPLNDPSIQEAKFLI